MDLNHDGRLDILTGSISGHVHVFYRKANGTYALGETLRRSFFRSFNCGRGSAVAAADWDGDGDIDLVMGNSQGGVFLATNKGRPEKPTWGSPERIKAKGRNIVADGGGAGPCVADWDADGKPDLVLGSGNGRVVWYRNLGTRTKPTFGESVTLIAPVEERASSRLSGGDRGRSGTYAKVCVADWNGDQLPDLVVGDYVYERDSRNRVKTHGYVWVYLQMRPTR